jgi:hypothetical protein
MKTQRFGQRYIVTTTSTAATSADTTIATAGTTKRR